MSLNKFHVVAITAWFAILVVLLGVELALGVHISTPQVVTLVLAACIPAIVLVTIFRGAPQSIGQLLYETDQAVVKTNDKEPRA